MNDEDRLDLALRVLFETFGVSPTPAQVEGYRMGLEGLPPDAIERAVRLAIRESDRFPFPAKIRELARRHFAEPLCPALPAIASERAAVLASWREKDQEAAELLAALPKAPPESPGFERLAAAVAKRMHDMHADAPTTIAQEGTPDAAGANPDPQGGQGTI